MDRPLLLAGKQIPLEQLSADEFQNFVYAALQLLGPRHGFRVDQMPANTGDGGFDAFGVRDSDLRGVCVQAKRMSTISIPDVGLELAKVSLSSRGNEPAYHYFLTSGKTRNVLQNALRETDRRQLADAASNAIERDELRELLKKSTLTTEDARAAAATYVKSLERLVVWSASEFDLQLSAVWSQLSDLLERHFTVQRVLVENPRPDFDESAYYGVQAFKRGAVDLELATTSLPRNVRITSAADPLSRASAPKKVSETSSDDAAEVLAATEIGSFALLVAPGGAGKSTTLEAAASVLAARRQAQEEVPIPVVLNLGSYRGSIRDLIHSKLRIRQGNWRSLAGPFLLFCDGLDETTVADLRSVHGELEELLKSKVIGVVGAMRASGLPVPVVFSGIRASYELRPMTVAQLRRFAAKILSASAASAFSTEVVARLNSGRTFFMRPFGLATALACYAERGSLFRTDRELVAEIVRRREQRNAELGPSDQPTISTSTANALARSVAVHTRVELRRSAFTKTEIEAAVVASLRDLKEAAIFGSDGLTSTAALEALMRSGFLIADANDIFRFEHDLVAGFLASEHVGRSWRTLDSSLRSRTADDAWRFAPPSVPVSERRDFFRTLFSIDPILASMAAGNCDDAENILDDLFAARVEKGFSSTFDKWQLFTALGIWASPRSIQLARDVLDTAAPEDDVTDQAKRALCMMGDRPTLTDVLKRADLMVSMPMKVSGGEVALFELAPPAVALELARAQVDGTNNGILGMCIRTFARYGNEEDAKRLRGIVASAVDLNVVLQAFYAIADSERDEVTRLLHARAKEADPSVRVHLLQACGTDPADVEWLWTFVTAVTAQGPEEERESLSSAKREAVKILASADLSPIRSRVIAAFDDADSETRTDIWQIAAEQKFEEFEVKAVAAVADPASGFAGYAANFAADHTWKDDALRTEFNARVGDALENDQLFFAWAGQRMFDYARRALPEATVADRLRRTVRVLFDALDEINKGTLPTLMTGGQNPLANQDLKSASFTVQMALGGLLDEVAALVKYFSPVELVRFVDAPNNYGKRDAQIEILEHVPAAEADVRLLGISDLWDRSEAVVRLSHCGETQSRVKALCECLKQFFHHPAMVGKLAESARRMWSDQMLSAIITVVCSAEPTDPNDQNRFAERGLTTLGNSVTRKQVSEKIAPVLAGAISNDARSILTLWMQMATQNPDETATSDLNDNG